ncbi:MAG: hemerythrin domain-containing protein [Ferruginibacter sp.]
MQRYNIFNLKHKGLRVMLYETAIDLQHTSFDNAESAAEAISKVESVLHAFHSHAEHEDKFVLPALKRYNAELIEEFQSEHAMDELLTQNINKLIAAFKFATDKEALTVAGYALTMAFNEFIAFNLYHMNKEENKINKTLWEYYNDAELAQITRTIIASIPPNILTEETRWMVKGASDTEIINWLLGVKNDAPDYVFKSLFTLVEEELPQQRIHAIQEGLTEGAMVA